MSHNWTYDFMKTARLEKSGSPLIVQNPLHQSQSVLVGYGPACPKFSEITNRQLLKLQKYANLGWHCQPIRLSDVLNVKNSKTIWGIKLIFCFHWSYKKHHAILGYDLKILLAYQFAGFVTFYLFGLLFLLLISSWWNLMLCWYLLIFCMTMCSGVLKTAAYSFLSKYPFTQLINCHCELY